MKCATSKTEHEPQRRRANRTPSLTMSTSDCAVLLRSWRTKRGGIISERHLFMRVLSVVPRYAVTVGSLKGGTVIGKTPEERGKLHLGFQTLTLCRVVEEIPARSGKMGHFYLKFQTQNFCRDVNKQELIGRIKVCRFVFTRLPRLRS